MLWYARHGESLAGAGLAVSKNAEVAPIHDAPQQLASIFKNLILCAIWPEYLVKYEGLFLLSAPSNACDLESFRLIFFYIFDAFFVAFTEWGAGFALPLLADFSRGHGASTSVYTYSSFHVLNGGLNFRDFFVFAQDLFLARRHLSLLQEEEPPFSGMIVTRHVFVEHRPAVIS